MARYIDADMLNEALREDYDREGAKADDMAIKGLADACVKYSHGQFCFLNAIERVKDTPAADVVPKSEVEELKKKLAETEVELMNVCLEKTNCDDMIQYILDFYFRRKVIEVFEEIEFDIHQLMFERDEHRAVAIEGVIAELKKKYTEGE